jgi:hypothetical protein
MLMAFLAAAALLIVGPAATALATTSQAALIITNSLRTKTVGSTVTLTTYGGSGTGAVTYVATVITGSGCSITDDALTSSAAATCSVVATKAASGSYASVSSPALIFKFITAASALLPQTPLRISNTTRSVATTDSITMTTTGGSGSGSVTYAKSGTGCVLTDDVLTATQATYCLVTATKAADSTYASTSSAALVFRFSAVSTLLTQTPLLISNTTRSALTSATVSLATSGGSGNGSVTYTVTGTGCSQPTSTTLAADRATVCVVTATKAAQGSYDSATSPALFFKFTVGTTLSPQLWLTVSNTTRVSTVGSPITLTTAGGSGTGAVTFAVVGTNCTQPTATTVSATGAALCLVTATKAADSEYASLTSPALLFKFTAS